MLSSNKETRQWRAKKIIWRAYCVRQTVSVHLTLYIRKWNSAWTRKAFGLPMFFSLLVFFSASIFFFLFYHLKQAISMHRDSLYTYLGTLLFFPFTQIRYRKIYRRNHRKCEKRSKTNIWNGKHIVGTIISRVEWTACLFVYVY